MPKISKKRNKNFKPKKVYFEGNKKIIEWTKSRKIISEEKLNKLRGQLQVTVKVSKKGRIPITVFGYSFIEDLRTKKGLTRARRTAELSAFARIPFSPDNLQIINEHFIYVEPLPA